MLFLLAHKLSDGRQALAINNGCFCGYEDLEEAKKCIPDWNKYHKSGLTWSTSAALYHISFNPCIAEVRDLDEVESILADRKFVTERTTWGSAVYTVVKPDSLRIVFERKLMDEGFNTATPIWEK